MSDCKNSKIVCHCSRLTIAVYNRGARRDSQRLKSGVRGALERKGFKPFSFLAKRRRSRSGGHSSVGQKLLSTALSKNLPA